MKLSAPRAKVDEIFFGGQKAARRVLLPQGEEAAEIRPGVSVVVPEEGMGCRNHTGLAELAEKVFGARDAAKDDGPGRRMNELDSALNAPEELTFKRGA